MFQRYASYYKSKYHRQAQNGVQRGAVAALVMIGMIQI
jgi:hypothetical protein